MGATVTAYSPYLLSIGLTLGEVGLVNAIYWGTMILAELPTGMLADGKSRAWSLKAGVLFHVVGSIFYICATGFVSAAVAEALIGVGAAFLSGAQSAWIADALDRDGEPESIREVQATDMLIRTPIFLLGGWFGAALAMVSYRLIWIPLVITGLLTAFLVHKRMNERGEPLHRVTEIEAFLLSVKQLRNSRSLMWIIGTMIFIGAVVSFNHYWAPFFEPMVGTLGLAWVWMVIYLSFMPSAWMVKKLSVAVGNEGKYIVLSLLLSGVGLTLAGLYGGLVFPLSAIVIHEFGRGMFEPLTESFVQHRVKSSYRATFGSLRSFLGNIGYAIVPVIIWFSIKGKPDTPETISQVWVICGTFLAIGAIIFWFIRPKKSE